MYSKTMYNMLYVLHRTTEPGLSTYVCDVSQLYTA